MHSYNECKRLGVMPGSRTFDKSMIPKIRQLIVTGVAMITGSVPPSTIVACLHLLIHYADHTQLFGILKWYWMMTFERYNRFVKNMCRNTHWPLASIANTYVQRAADHYDQISSDVMSTPVCTCSLLGRNRVWKGIDVPDVVITTLFG